MDVRILSHEQVEFQEREVHRTLEENLSKLDEDLEFIASEVTIGTGRIDTLAVDPETNQPILTEFKKRSEFNKDAVVRPTDYVSWFARDENRMGRLTRWKLQRSDAPESEIEPRTRVTRIVTDIEDRVQSAVYVIANNVKKLAHVVSRDTTENVVLVPKLEVDDREIEAQVPEVASGSEIPRRNAPVAPLPEGVRAALRNDGAHEYSGRNQVRCRDQSVFAKVWSTTKSLFPELRVDRGSVRESLRTHWRDGCSSWGYIHLRPEEAPEPMVLEWIELTKWSLPFKNDDDVAQEEDRTE